MTEKKPISGPYRATKLWNDAVRSFYNGMPVSRHWRGLRQHDRCFTATEAVDWLHIHLQNDDNFGSSVTRDQTVKLLRKFLKSGLIEDVRGVSIKPEDFKDNRELYRFSNRSPLKALRTPKTPGRSVLSNKNSNSSNPSETDLGASPVLRKKADTSDEKESKLPRQESVRPRLGSVRLKKVKRTSSSQENQSKGDNTINECKEGDGMQECHLVGRVLTPPETEEVWKNVLLTRLGSLCERLLFGDSASILDASLVKGSWVHHNMTQVTSRGVVQMPQGHPDDLPNWILTAMRCLAHWPNSTESSCNIPNYPGVEKDVFKIVKEFFTNLVVPLIPSDLYETIIRLYIGAEFLDITYRSPGSTASPTSSFSHSQEGSYNTEDFSDSVEDLMLNMSITGTQKTSTPCYDELNNVNMNKDLVSGEFRRQGSTRSTASGMHTPSLRRAAVFNTSKLQSLKLRRLKQYTDFKDSGLYPTLLEGSHENSVLQNSSENQENIRPGSRSSSRQPGSRPSSRSSSRIEYIKRKTEGDRERTHTADSTNSFDKSDNIKPLYSSVNNQEITTTTLPPNTCFETAFTSDSPQTRIIPQVSVDTIHLNPRVRTVKSAKRRPKSIAVAPLSESTAHHLFDTTRDIKNLSTMSDLFKSSLTSSCASDDYMTASLQSPLNRSRSTGNLQAIDVENAEGISLCSSFNTQPRNSFLAARVRDSIKRKHIRDETLHRKRSNGGRGSHFKDISLDDDSQNLNRLRTKSGGYMNLGLSNFETSLDDVHIIKSEYHLNSNSDYADLGGLQHMRTKSGGFLNLALAPSSDSVDCSDNTMDSADTFSCPPTSRSDSAVIDSQKLIRRENLTTGTAPNTDKIRRKMSVGNGCLSHSCSSGDSIYHSAVSHCSRCGTGSPNSLQGPPLPPKTPRSSRTRPASAGMSSHNYENLLDVSRPLSTSANQLSDGYADRTPYGKNPPSYTQGSLWRAFHASPRLLTREGKEVAVSCMQLVLLLLDPVRRRKLHLLLRMMSKCAGNDKLSLASDQTTRALVLNTFSRSILLSEREADYDEMLSMRITTFLMDNHEEVFRPPQDLAVMVHRRITQLQRQQVVYGPLMGDERGMMHTYCQQVTKEKYERQKLTGSQQFIAQLLDQIIDNRQLSSRSKKKQLKEFKATYPDIYAARFPNEPVKVESKSKMKSLIKLASLSSLGKNRTLRM